MTAARIVGLLVAGRSCALGSRTRRSDFSTLETPLATPTSSQLVKSGRPYQRVFSASWELGTDDGNIRACGSRWRGDEAATPSDMGGGPPRDLMACALLSLWTWGDPRRIDGDPPGRWQWNSSKIYALLVRISILIRTMLVYFDLHRKCEKSIA